MIFLYGPPGCGKSTVGRLIAESLEVPFLDLDNEIELQSGISIPEIFEREGEKGFRSLESRFLQRIVTNEDKVVALGGGALLSEDNRSLIEKFGSVFCLIADLQTLLARARSNPERRPLLAGNLASNLSNLLDQRRGHYASFSEKIDTTSRSLQQVAWEVQVRMGRFRIKGMGASYNVFSSPGILNQVGSQLEQVGASRTVVVVSDTNVAPIYAEKLRTALRIGDIHPRFAIISAGEAKKTLNTVTQLWDAFVEARMERSNTVVALGGGVVGDLAGFAASVFLRGINWIVLPTTLLSMVDSSLGGKTGFDLPMGKNLVGSFYPPRLVLADIMTLETLPEVELRNGLAEVVKHGVIGDPQLFETCQKGWNVVQSKWIDIVHRAMAVKVRVIQEDPFEKGPRAALNLGHTIGHALEKASNYQVRHGEAVAIGMVAEARLAERIGLAERGLSEIIAYTLIGLGLPTEIPLHLDTELIETAMQLDKKRAEGVVRFALPVRIGEVKVGVEVGDMRFLFERRISG